MNSEIRGYVAKILKKWKIEYLKFKDELDKELRRIEKTNAK